MKSKLIFIFVLFAIALLLFGCTQQAESSSIKIGAVLPMSGSAASYGETWANALSIALDDFKRDTNSNAVFLIEDSQLKPEMVVSATQKLIEVDQVRGIVTGSDTLVLLPITGPKKVLVFTAASNPDITLKHNFVFRINPSDLEQGKKMAELISKYGFSSVEVIGFEGEYGRGLAGAFSENFEDGGGKRVFSQFFSDMESDFRSVLTKVKGNNADALFIIALDSQYPQILKQAKELDINMKIFASETIHSDSVLRDSNSLADGVTFFYFPPNGNSKFKDFESKYLLKFGAEPGPFADSIYDAGLLALYSAYNSGNNSDKAFSYLHSLSNWSGASGNITFDAKGDPIGKTFELYTIKNGEFVLLGDSND